MHLFQGDFELQPEPVSVFQQAVSVMIVCFLTQKNVY